MEAAAVNNAALTCVTFRLEQELYALEIDRVHEVLDLTPITRVPRTPDFMRGVINLRGNVVPVVDLRRKFGMSATEDTVDTRIIIMEVSLEGESTMLGALADAVREVRQIEADALGPPPRMGTRVRTDFIRSLAHVDEQFIMVLDIDKAFSGEELAMVQAGEQAYATQAAESAGNRAGTPRSAEGEAEAGTPAPEAGPQQEHEVEPGTAGPAAAPAGAWADAASSAPGPASER